MIAFDLLYTILQAPEHYKILHYFEQCLTQIAGDDSLLQLDEFKEVLGIETFGMLHAGGGEVL